MAYTKQTWANGAGGGTPISADRLNHMETGIKEASDASGTPGPANTLDIGTVTTVDPGDDATASITGTSPNQTLNLGIPKGSPGNDGDLLTMGTVTTVAAGGNATATITGTSPNKKLNLGIPSGQDGQDGDNGAPGDLLTIGTVTTVAAGGNATASITGTSPNKELNLGIPRGAKGDQGDPGVGSLVLNAGDPVPGGTPDGTIIFDRVV